MSEPYTPQHAMPIEEVARKRGIQTLLTGLGTDVTVALALVLATTVVPGMESWASVEASWSLWLLVGLRSVIQAVASWAIRRWADPSSTAIRQAEPERVADEGWQ